MVVVIFQNFSKVSYLTLLGTNFNLEGTVE